VRTDDEGLQDRSSEAYFADQLLAFQKETELASRVSKAIGGRFVSERVGWSQWMHLRLCIAADSLIRVASLQDRIENCEVCTLDQSTIASISRGMIEAAVMIAYMTDQSLTDPQWKLRRLIICLHDATTRYKMFKGWKDDAEAAAHFENRKQLRADIESVDKFKSLPEDRRSKLLSGQEVYLLGLRSVLRLMDWDKDDFNSVYAYLSSHAHSSPVSFIRLNEHGVDFLKPTKAKYGIGGFALERARSVLKFATRQILILFPDAAVSE
jgi:hypothetical protein